MILGAVNIAKIAIILIVGLMIRKSIKSLTKKQMVGIALALAVFSIMTQFSLKAVPPLTEEFTLTALGEHNKSAQAEEVYLRGVTVDGKAVPISRPIEGKWFWAGENYAWRIETDTRQPEGNTRSVTLKIPVGWSRSLQFESDVWRGLVQIDYLEQSEIYDTYAANNQVTSFQLPESPKKLLIANEAIKLVVFAVAFAALSLAFYLVLCIWRKDPNSIKEWTKRNDYRLACGAVSLVALLFMIRYSAVESLWNDEIWQISFAIKNERIWKQLLITPSFYPSLFGRILDVWYHIAPFGERYLLLPSMVTTAIGVYFIGLTGVALRNLRTGVVAAVFAGFANTLIYQCAYEFRSYGFLLCMSAITLWLYIRQRGNDNAKIVQRLLFGLSMWLTASSHIFGLFFCIPFFMMDIVFYVKKRISINQILSYIFAIILYSPWLYNMITFRAFEYQATWQGYPSFGAVASLMNFLTGSNIHIYMLTLFGFCVVVIALFMQRKDKSNVLRYLEFFPVLSIAFVVCLLFVYGRYVNQTATMWMDRYFIVLFPCTFLLAAIGLDTLLQQVDGKRLMSYSLCTAIMIFITLNSHFSLTNRLEAGYQHYREAANWLYSQANTIYNKDTLIIYGPDAPLIAWQDYYLTQKGRRDPIDIIDQRIVTPEDIAEKNVVYLYYEHFPISPSITDMLEAQFDQAYNDGYLKVATFVRRK